CVFVLCLLIKMKSPKVILAIVALVFLLSIKPFEATRILDEEEEQWMKRGQNLLLPSLQRGRPVGPPSPNGCTWIPGSGGKPCTASISERNFAVIASHPPPPPDTNDAYPKQMVQFGVASGAK
ncbi:hypothetical protein Pfo_006405, partial [Paulownia fortunei]